MTPAVDGVPTYFTPHRDELSGRSTLMIEEGRSERMRRWDFLGRKLVLKR